MLKKMGYGGKGLGKHENGILEPISIQEKTKLGVDAVNRGLTDIFLGGSGNLNSKRPQNNDATYPWPKGTTLITGDSIICGVEENRLSKGKAKVRSFLGARVSDMYDYLTPLLKKKPSYIILHIGSNDAPDKTADQIVGEILELNANIESILPTVKIYISCPTIRYDNAKANMILSQLTEKMKSVTMNIILNDNVDRSCIGRRGLYLNQKGSGRLAIN